MTTILDHRWQFLQPRRTRVAVCGYVSLGDIIAKTADKIFTPAEQISVSKAAEKYVNIETAGAWTKFINETAPYMVEPMDITESREFKGCVFVSSAQSGKTASLILNKMAYNIAVSGMDMMIVCQSGGAATDFAVRRVDRTVSHSELLKSQLLQVRNSDNQKRKQFKNGMLLTIAHPSKNELSGKPVGVVALTDYDRMEDDIDGEGDAYGLAAKRTQTFQSYAMTIAESSPSRPVTDPKKILDKHEAPPCKGILDLYNRGDRRMWYWPCPHCDEYFTPSWSLIQYEARPSPKESAQTVGMGCPACGVVISPDHRHEMQQWGVWLGAGQRFENGRIVGERRSSSIASFWLDGTAAAFTTWPELVEEYLNAKNTLDEKADEAPLKKFWNTSLGRPYVPKSQESERTPEILMSRAEPLGEKVVPEGVVALVNVIDIQKNSFEVSTVGIGEGTPFDMTLVNRYAVRKSLRYDEDGERYMVRPSTFQDDWDLLIENVMLRGYPLADGSGRTMQAKLTLCDAGGHWARRAVRAPGSGGVTEKAYQFYRSLVAKGLAGRFHLVRGSGQKNGKRAWLDRPDGNSGKMGIARGDVPVLYLASDDVKDVLNTRLDVLEPGRGMVHFPDWLPADVYGELCAETWSPEKGWENRAKRRNETWDHLYYLVGAGFSPLLPMERVDWSHPPAWLRPWDDNPFVLPPAEDDEESGPAVPFERRRKKVDFAALGAAVG